jgi:prevent-host-death family protein
MVTKHKATYDRSVKDTRTVRASTFKAQCLALLDQVERTHVEIVVTKRGRPVARVVPLDRPESRQSTDHSVTLLADEDEAYFSTGERWEAQGDEPT